MNELMSSSPSYYQIWHYVENIPQQRIYTVNNLILEKCSLFLIFLPKSRVFKGMPTLHKDTYQKTATKHYIHIHALFPNGGQFCINSLLPFSFQRSDL